ncbi:hypothetical protein [Roseivirga seohaensis]|uniref:hypothetical protein n=1 Tax=Roseivirga seohaensis TaxID=1914963 RepID=UPI003BA96F0F
MNSIKTQTLRLLVFSGVVFLLIFVLDKVPVTSGLIHEKAYGLYVFITVLSFVLSIGTLFFIKNTDQNVWKGVFMGVMVIRLLFTIAYIAIVLYLGIEDRLLFVINLFVVYLFYMVFEIMGLVSNLRAISKKAE